MAESTISSLSGTTPLYSFVVWSFVVMLLILAFYVVIWFARKKFIGRHDKIASADAMSLDEYARLRDSGMISSEEYGRIRRKTLGLAKDAGSQRPQDAPAGEASQMEVIEPVKTGDSPVETDDGNKEKLKDSNNESSK